MAIGIHGHMTQSLLQDFHPGVLKQEHGRMAVPHVVDLTQGRAEHAPKRKCETIRLQDILMYLKKIQIQQRFHKGALA